MPGQRATRRVILRSALLVVASQLPQHAHASCSVAADLATLHGAYTDLIEGRGTPREDIGRFVIERELGSSADTPLTNTLNSTGFYDTMDQLQPVLDDMARLAKNGVQGEDLSLHRQNVENLNTTLRTTGCFEEPAAEIDDTSDTEETVSADPEDTPPDATSNIEDNSPGAMKKFAQMMSDRSPGSYIALGVLCLGLIGLAILVRRMIKNARARSYPRMPFGGALPITDASDRRVDRIVVDISLGGIMVERPAVIDIAPFKRVKVHLPDGEFSLRLAWENTHFFGYQFDTPIGEDVLANVMAMDIVPRNAPEPESQNSDMAGAKDEAPNTNSAPEGAAESPI